MEVVGRFDTYKTVIIQINAYHPEWNVIKGLFCGRVF